MKGFNNEGSYSYSAVNVFSHSCHYYRDQIGASLDYEEEQDTRVAIYRLRISFLLSKPIEKSSMIQQSKSSQGKSIPICQPPQRFLSFRSGKYKSIQ